MTAKLVDFITDLFTRVENAGYTVLPSEAPITIGAKNVIIDCPLPGTGVQYGVNSGNYWALSAQLSAYDHTKLALVQEQQALIDLLNSWHWNVSLRRRCINAYVQWNPNIKMYEAVTAYDFEWYEVY